MTARFRDFHLEGEDTLGQGKYLRLRRVHLRNVYQDGSFSEPYFCEFVDRPAHGTDAVVVGLWRKKKGAVQVLLRQGLRPALRFGRKQGSQPQPVSRLWEAVAGILEPGDLGLEGIKHRAVLEAWEEAGVQLPQTDVCFLGPAMFASPGMTPEAFHFLAAEVKTEPMRPPGDGSPMEQGAETAWFLLDEALSKCETGEIVDLKTEVLLRRLKTARLAPG